MKLVVGLGNPGKEYENTRHNIGFMVIDKFAQVNHLLFSKSKLKGEYAIFENHEEKIILLKPQTYMNLSGEAVSAFMNYYKIELEDILIISDDLDMSVGKLKLKPKGSSGGHNGLKNIELHLHSSAYKRLKIGISKNKEYDIKDYVLSKFPSEEKATLDSVLETAVEIIDDFSKMTFDKLMNKYNKK